MYIKIKHKTFANQIQQFLTVEMGEFIYYSAREIIRGDDKWQGWENDFTLKKGVSSR